MVSCTPLDVVRYVDPNIGTVAPLLTTKTPTVHPWYHRVLLEDDDILA